MFSGLQGDWITYFSTVLELLSRWCSFSQGERCSFHPGRLDYIGDDIPPNYMGNLISQYKDPYKPISIMECRQRCKRCSGGICWFAGCYSCKYPLPSVSGGISPCSCWTINSNEKKHLVAWLQRSPKNCPFTFGFLQFKKPLLQDPFTKMKTRNLQKKYFTISLFSHKPMPHAKTNMSPEKKSGWKTCRPFLLDPGSFLVTCQGVYKVSPNQW